MGTDMTLIDVTQGDAGGVERMERIRLALDGWARRRPRNPQAIVRLGVANSKLSATTGGPLQPSRRTSSTDIRHP